MSELLKRAIELKSEIIENRRAIHSFAEVDFDLPKTTERVMQELVAYGYTPQRVGKAGISCVAGHTGKTILLRADMDALKVTETTGLPYSSQNSNCHACGHDAHTSMLLGAAKILKERESSLKGRVKFMFQPAEEILAGAADMIEGGILENPKVDAALALHISVGIDTAESGSVYYGSGSLTYSADCMRITVKGVAAHGSTPYLGVDAIQVASNIVIALQNIVAKEIAMSDQALVLIGKIEGGSVPNAVADTVILDGTTRASERETRALLKKRVAEIASGVAQTYGATAETEFIYGMPPLINDPELAERFKTYSEELLGASKVIRVERFGGSEDFSALCERVPSVFMMIGVGGLSEGYNLSLHNPALVLNEDALPVGAAIYAQCAMRWLEEE